MLKSRRLTNCSKPHVNTTVRRLTVPLRTFMHSFVKTPPAFKNAKRSSGHVLEGPLLPQVTKLTRVPGGTSVPACRDCCTTIGGGIDPGGFGRVRTVPTIEHARLLLWRGRFRGHVVAGNALLDSVAESVVVPASGQLPAT